MSDAVSRETPPAPSEARGVFPSDRLPVVEAYADLLADAGVTRGLIGPREVPRLWERHLLNSGVLAPQIPHGATVCDVGSGAGLPGLVLAISRPDLDVTLLEPLLRRTTFLSEAVEALELPNVEVVRGRAEEQHGARTFSVVTSRAVAPLDRLLVWCMPLVAPVGALVALKGSSIHAEISSAERTLARFGCTPPEVVELGRDVLHSQTWAVRVAWGDPGRVTWPGAEVSGRARPGSAQARRRKA